MSEPQDILARAALKHLAPGGKITSGSMNIDMHLMLSGLVEIAPDITLRLTEAGRAALAQGIETRSAIDPKGRGPKGESPVAESDAPTSSPGDTSNA